MNNLPNKYINENEQIPLNSGVLKYKGKQTWKIWINGATRLY